MIIIVFSYTDINRDSDGDGLRYFFLENLSWIRDFHIQENILIISFPGIMLMTSMMTMMGF